MPPIRPEDHAYRFRPSMLRELREQLKLTQAQMADLLEIPVNTLSRWELGNNLPDANALAAIYSVAAGRGVKPQFFEERRITMSQFKKRKNRIIDWDFQNRGVDAEDIGETCNELNRYLNLRYGHPSTRIRYAYLPARMVASRDVKHSPQGQALQEAGFEVVKCDFDADRQIMEDGADLFGSSDDHKPNESVYLLISDDGDYADFLKGFRSAGVETLVFGTDNCSQRLIKAVGPDHFIPFNRPHVIFKVLDVVRKLNGNPTNKSEFGNQCRKALEKAGWDEFPEDTGFSLNRPYASALQHMTTIGLVNVKQVGNDPNRITITEVKR